MSPGPSRPTRSASPSHQNRVPGPQPSLQGISFSAASQLRTWLPSVLRGLLATFLISQDWLSPERMSLLSLFLLPLLLPFPLSLWISHPPGDPPPRATPSPLWWDCKTNTKSTVSWMTDVCLVWEKNGQGKQSRGFLLLR